MILGERIVAQARTYLDAPWWHTGRSRQGVDCIGLLACVAHDLGITDYDDVDYALESSAEKLTETLRRFCYLVYRAPEATQVLLEPIWFLPGDLLQFSIAGSPRHCGIYARDEIYPSLIHAYQSVGKVVEHPFDIHWRRRLFAAYRLREGGG